MIHKLNNFISIGINFNKIGIENSNKTILIVNMYSLGVNLTIDNTKITIVLEKR